MKDDYIFSQIMQGVLNKVFSLLPFLNIPVLKQVISFLITKLFEKIYEEIKIYGGIFIVNIEVNGQVKKYDEAVQALKNSKPEDRENALQKHRDALRNLITFKP